MLGKSLQEKLFLNFDVKEGLGSPVMLSTFFGVYGARYLSQKFFSYHIEIFYCAFAKEVSIYFAFFFISLSFLRPYMAIMLITGNDSFGNFQQGM